MSGSKLNLSLVTLGVESLDRAAAFYEGLGLVRAGVDSEGVVFFELGGAALALFPRRELAKDAGVAPEGNGFRGIALAWNRSSSDEVDAAIATAAALGGRVVKPAQKVFWGGYSGYVEDPDGHLWEIAFNPHWPLRDNGTIQLPPPIAKTG